MKHLKKLEVFNLWGKDKVTVDFNEDVTFLTGLNGSGKSTILNILFDVLKTEETQQKVISKSRFWAAKATLSDQDVFQTASFPVIEGFNDFLSEIQSIIDEKHHGDICNIQALREVEALYKDKLNTQNNVIYSVFSRQSKGVTRLRKDLLKSDQGFNPFIYQEDKKSLHDPKKNNLDLSHSYWEHYGTSLDEKLLYVLNSFQLFEAKAFRAFSDEMSQALTSGNLKKIIEKQRSSNLSSRHIVETLEAYFAPLGKKVTRDEDERLAIKVIDSEELIPWYGLSRGEKTLIYIMLTVFLYQEKVSIFLFDEPEISMHLDWQKSLVRDMTKMAPNCQFVIVTHSPAIVMDGWLDKTVKVEL